jgi:FlaA1/EpsC-like NDP-sugar epimerase
MTDSAQTKHNPPGGILVRHRTLISIGVYAFLFTLSLLLSFALAHNFRLRVGEGAEIYWPVDQFLPIFPLNVGVKLIVFGLLRQYRSSWRYVGLRDWLSVIKASQLSAFAFIVLFFLIVNIAPSRAFLTFPQSIFLLDWAGTSALVCVARIGFRLYQEELRVTTGRRIRTLIVGAGDSGAALLRELTRSAQARNEVVGFVDDDASKMNAMILGVEVLGQTGRIREFCEKHDIEEVLIAIPSAPQREIRRIIELCQGMNLRFTTVPAVTDLIEGKVQVSQIRDVSIEDLLGRDPVNLDQEGIASYIRGKRVLVTGAGGSIGSEMCRQIARYSPQKLVLLERAENNLFEIDRELRRDFKDLNIVPHVADIGDAERIRVVFERERPEAVFHAAAHKHVPMMECNPGEAAKNNVLGTKTIADAAVKAGTEKMVMISTDKAVNPTSVMGCTKRIAEIYVQHLSRRASTQFVTVRFGNVLGSSGSVIPVFKDQIARGGPVTVTHPDMVRYFMTIPEASQLVLQAGAMGRGGEIFVLDMGEPVKIVDLARDLITLSGLRPGEDIEIQFSGIRPGEKLYEELLIEGEGISKTKHPQIGVWAFREENWNEVGRGIERLLQLADEDQADAIRGQLAVMVPEYQPNPTPNQTVPAPAAHPELPSVIPTVGLIAPGPAGADVA